MAGFSFSEEQEAFRREVCRFSQRELAPGAKERAKRRGIPWELIKKIADLGLLGLNIPAKYGGQPADWITVGIAVEEMARVDWNVAILPQSPIAMSLSMEHSPEELKEEFLPPLVRGEKLAFFALTEPHCGSDAGAITTRAIRDGDDWVINGEKSGLTYGMQAHLAMLYAKTDPTAGVSGISCFLVPLDLPGVTRSPFSDTGQKPLQRGAIALQDVHIPANYLLGEEGRGFPLVMGLFDFARVLNSLQALGAAQASLEEAIAYARERTAFGRPIAKFEGVSFKIAEHATLIEAARILCYRALWLRDQGLPHIKEAAMGKWLGAQVAFNAIHDCLLLHGHFGFSEELPLEQRLRDSIGLEMADGTPEIMKLIISREIIGREFVPYR